MSQKKIVILGTGGNCIDILDTINDINRITPTYEVVGFLDDNPAVASKTFRGVSVVGTLSDAQQFDDCVFVNGIGSTGNHAKRQEIIGATGISVDRFETIIHPSASVSAMATLGRGVVVFQQVVITSNVNIGDHVTILPLSVVSHDSQIGDYTILAGGVCISGNVHVGEACYIGSNVSVKEGLNIGNKSLVGMGSVVIGDVEEGNRMAGNPARAI